MCRTALMSIAVLAVLVVPLGAGASEAPRPSLHVVDKAPLVLKGTFFKPSESVRLTVTTARTELVRRTRASRVGTFVLRFDTRVDVCNGARTASAVGARGSHATLVFEAPLARECPELQDLP